MAPSSPGPAGLAPTDDPTPRPSLASWIFGGLFLWGGLMGSGPAITHLAWLVMGALLFPPTRRLVQRQTSWTLAPRTLRRVVLAGLVLTFVVAALEVAAAPAQSDQDWWERFYADYYGG